MKVYHPVEYMSALLTFEMGDTDKVVEYIEECRRMAVGVLPPDVNLSDKDFTPIYEEKQEGKRKAKKTDGVIRFGMMAVRGGGGGVLPEMEEIASADLLKFEKELLGFYITSHPLTEHQATLERYSTHSAKDALNVSEGTEVTIGGMINRVKTSITKNGRSAGQ